MYVFMFCLCATGGCETASYTFLFRHISVLAQDARDGCCFFSLESIDYNIITFTVRPILYCAGTDYQACLLNGNVVAVRRGCSECRGQCTRVGLPIDGSTKGQAGSCLRIEYQAACSDVISISNVVGYFPIICRISCRFRCSVLRVERTVVLDATQCVSTACHLVGCEASPSVRRDVQHKAGHPVFEAGISGSIIRVVEFYSGAVLTCRCTHCEHEVEVLLVALVIGSYIRYCHFSVVFLTVFIKRIVSAEIYRFVRILEEDADDEPPECVKLPSPAVVT